MSAHDVSSNVRTASAVRPPDTIPARPAETEGPRPLSLADPVPLGIAAFAMTTFVLSCLNAGFFSGVSGTPIVLGLAVFYGGLVQLLAGLWAFRRAETFAAVAFCSYGGFWLSYFFAVFFIVPHLSPSIAGEAIGVYLLGWLIFTAYMSIAALRTSLPILGVFVALTATFLLLTLAEFGEASSTLLRVGGYVGIVTAVLAWYVAFAHVVNATFGRELIPTLPLTR